MNRTAAKLLHFVLVCALALGTVVLPSLSRCVDAAGHDEIELSNADCCEGAADAGIEPAGSCFGGCLDGRLIVPSLSRSPAGKHVVEAPLLPVPFSFAIDADVGSLVRRAPAQGSQDAIAAHALRARSISVLIC